MKLKDLMKSSFLTYETSQLLTNPEFGYTILSIIKEGISSKLIA